MSDRKQLVSKSFDRAAKNFDEFAFLQKEVASRLFERLDIMKLSPANILDAGCGTGYCSRILNKTYSKAKVFGVDLSQGMIEEAKKSNGFFNKIDYQVSDIEQLPFDNNQFDLVFSNMSAHWLEDYKQVFTEFNRVLKPGGLLIFSTLGFETLLELRESWQQVDSSVSLWDFYDMHIIGDQVFNAQFDNTVMDRDIITLTYKTLLGLLKDLRAGGAMNMKKSPQIRLTKARLSQLNKNYANFKWEDGSLPATAEIVYGHAWKKTEQPKGDYHTYQLEINDNS